MSTNKLTVNIHFLRCCNYHCKFCFHRGIENSATLSYDKWMNVIDNIADSGLVKRINLAGGEPFLLPKLCANLIHYIKNKGIETSVITNSSLLTQKVFDSVKNDLDMVGISVDSGNDEVNYNIGRNSRDDDQDQPHCYHVKRVSKMVKDAGKCLKLNTVICKENLYDDSIFELVSEVLPSRWKVFRVLKIENENGVEKDERKPYEGYITDEEWESWKERCACKCSVHPVIEDNDDMLTSYILVDEEGFVLDSSSGSKVQKCSLLDTNLKSVIEEIGFNEQKFIKRGGIFDIMDQNKIDIEDIVQ